MGAGGKGGGGSQVTDYRMSVHLGVCSGADAVTGIYIDGKTAWEGEVTLNSTIRINQPDLFGGQTLSGGAVGAVEVMLGGATQRVPASLASALGGTPATVPGFRGLLSLYFTGMASVFNWSALRDLDLTGSGSGQGFLWSTNNPVIAQNVDVRLRRCPTGLDSTIARIPAAQDVGFVSGVGYSASDAATHAANAINASSQYFTASASGAVVTITEKNTYNSWVNAVSPTADAMYPYRASVVNPADHTSYIYYYSIVGFTAGTATLTIENVPQTGMTFSVGPETYTFSSYAGDDANPAHILYDVIVDDDYGLGYPSTLIDVPSFEYAASILFGESLGLSMMWAQQSSVEDFVNEVLNHINGVLYISPTTGMFTLKLLRGDYTLGSLQVFTPDDAVMTNFQRKLWPETINEVIVQWTNPITEETETVGAQNPANISIQGGIVSDTRNYYGVRNAVLAAKLAAREVRAVSVPLCSMDISVNRDAWSTAPGDVVMINWPENNLYGKVMRVGLINYGSADSPEIKVSLAEDIFGLEQPTVTPSPATQWVDPSVAPTDFTNTQLIGVPYFFSTSNELVGSTSSLTYPEVQAAVLAYAPSRDTTGFVLSGEYTDAAGNVGWTDFGTKNICEMGASPPLSAETTSTIPTAQFAASDRAPTIGSFILIGTGDTSQELALVTGSDGTNYTVNRGCLDTVPQAWSAGTPMWALNPTLNIIDTVTIRSVAEVVKYKLRARTSQGILALSDATEHDMTMTARYYLPLRPANVKVNGTAFGSVPIGGSTTIAVTWATRNRTLEDGQALAWTDGAVAPEYQQETIVTVYDQTGMQVYQQAGLWTDTSLTMQASWFARYTSIKILVSSRLNGTLNSLQGYAITVTGLPGTTSAPLPPAPAAITPAPSPIAAPINASWSVSGTSLSGTAGDATPAIIVTGMPDAGTDIDLIIRYKQTSDSAWTYAPMVALSGAAVTTQITGLAASTAYNVQLAYQASYGTSGNILSAWLTPSTSPVTTGTSTSVSAANIGSTPASAALLAIANASSAASSAATNAAAAVSSANTAISNLNAEISRATGAEGTLTTTIASLNSTVSALTATVSSNYSALSTANSATAASVTTLRAYATPNPNLVSNPTGASGMWNWHQSWTAPISDVQGSYGEGYFFQCTSGSNSAGSAAYYQDIAYHAAGPISIQAEIYSGGVTHTTGTYASNYIQVEYRSDTANLGWSNSAGPVGGSFWTLSKAENQTVPTGTTTLRVWMAINGDGNWTNTNCAWRKIKVESGAYCTAYTDDITAGTIAGVLSSETVTRASADSVLTASITTLTSQYNSLNSTVSSNYSALSTANSATAASVTTLSATTSSLSGSISTLNSVTATLSGQVYGTYGLTVNTGGAIAGLTLYASGGSTHYSTVVFEASTFIIKDSSHPTISPFYYDATTGTLFLNAITVNSVNIANNAVSTPWSASSSTSQTLSSGVDTTVATLTITAAGTGIIDFLVSATVSATSSTYMPTYFKVYRNASLVGSVLVNYLNVYFYSIAQIIDNPPAGVYTYTFKINAPFTGTGACLACVFNGIALAK